MGDSHRHLGITEDEWASFMDDLHQSPARFQVPRAEEQELVAIVESTKEAIVVATLQPTSSNGQQLPQQRKAEELPETTEAVS
jgi:hypothetical protein